MRHFEVFAKTQEYRGVIITNPQGIQIFMITKLL